MNNEHWIAVADSADLAAEHAIEVVAGGLVVAIFRHEGNLFALDGMCAHQGGPIASGEIAHGCVTCPWHGWQYELKTGIQTVNRQPLQTTYPVRETDGKIELQLPNAEA